MRDTKERILYEALDLFSVEGYDGVSMTEIADRVGIKAASIYKHYKGKEDIFHTIVQQFEERTEHIFQPVVSVEEDYDGMAAGMLVQMVQQAFQLYAEEPFLSKCRKLFMISAFGRPEIGTLYVKYFIEMPMEYQSGIFGVMQEAKHFKGRDTAVMASHFYAPILILLQEYDYSRITMDEAFRRIELLILQFTEVYSI